MRFVAGCVQLTSRGDLGGNLATCARLVDEARSRGAQLIVLPENFALMAVSERDKLALAESLTSRGSILGALHEMARGACAWLVAGGFPEATPHAGKVYNTCVVLRPDGTLAGAYRKIHLFDIAIPGAAQFQESATVEPGNEVVVVDTPWGGLGLSICYDLRFPELYRALVSKGARLVVVPAAFTLHTGKDHWHPLLRARAIENQVFVLAAAQHGRANDKRISYGHSLIVDPWGTVLAEAPDRDCVITAELDLDDQDKMRRELPCLEHKRLPG